jgi:ZIP family zinc transporter
MGTFIGGVLVVLFAKIYGMKSEISTKTKSIIGVFEAFSAGVMIYMTFIDLIPESTTKLGSTQTLLWFFVGVVMFMILEKLIPEESQPAPKKGRSKKSTDMNALLRTSLITYIALAMHNLPEGLGVYLSALSNLSLGFELALGIMLHNIPEGMAVAIPLWAATGSSYYVILMTFFNGLFEPIGVIFGGFLLRNYMDELVLSRCLAAVSGIMACISIDELLPSAIKYSGKEVSTRSFFFGMFLCFCALETVHYYFNL